MEFLNKIQLRGIVGKVFSTKPVINFSLFTESVFNSKDGGMAADITWFSINCLPTNCVGTIEPKKTVYVEGRMRTRRYVDSNGNDKVSYDVVAQTCKVED